MHCMNEISCCSYSCSCSCERRPLRRSPLLNRVRRKLQETGALLANRPSLIFITLLTCVTLLGAGLAAVLTASSATVSRSKDLARNGLGNGVAVTIAEALKQTVFGSELLSSHVTQMPRCPDLEASWQALSLDILSRVDTQVVVQLELDFAGIIWRTWPPLEGQLAKVLYGKDLLAEDGSRQGTLEMMRQGVTAIVGPYQCTEGFACMFTVNPLSLPAPSADYDWGCGMQPHNCSECFHAANKTKYWGQVSTMFNLDELISRDAFRLQSLARDGYAYRLWQEETSINNLRAELAASAQRPADPMRIAIKAYNLLWHLELAPADGWVPAWRGPCIAAVVVGSVAVSLLVLWLLVSKEQHNRLLKAMLPDQVIAQLQDGEGTVAQQYDDVTVLVGDMVGYTTAASQLSACQVVSLLNELFGMFDDLAQRNGVYKVETTGDAILCVAGCPVPDDAVRNAVRAAGMALDMVAAVERFKPSLEGVRVQIRVGLHSGPVVAGVVGKKMPRFCLFGDTVNTASRMEGTASAMRIQVSEATATLLRESGESFALEPRGVMNLKGKGAMETFWLLAPARSTGTGTSGPTTAHASGATTPGTTPSLSQQQHRRAGTSTCTGPAGGLGATGADQPRRSDSAPLRSTPSPCTAARSGHAQGQGGDSATASGGGCVPRSTTTLPGVVRVAAPVPDRGQQRGAAAGVAGGAGAVSPASSCTPAPHVPSTCVSVDAGPSLARSLQPPAPPLQPQLTTALAPGALGAASPPRPVPAHATLAAAPRLTPAVGSTQGTAQSSIEIVLSE
ncbi:hypothetical protein HXX76_009578 [Chlamydomonas incerta]|uniref:Guanylate cyclase domain-containing protein n=1 Tax=Chlamydomonas incerta TaxID=51695 RepID=A0A835VZM9_CHLIN|nr:hypothetical protein HXX76_009578 [Chlamydomonas incerta]|eukprot:KAG2431564.1 hypothetical protein HXX76_009578 [Chlamydomonas incerta]